MIHTVLPVGSLPVWPHSLALGEALRQVVPVRAFASHHPLKFGMMLAQPDTLRGMQRRAGDLGREPRLEAVLRNHSPSIK